jgi:hypothetical protein
MTEINMHSRDIQDMKNTLKPSVVDGAGSDNEGEDSKPSAAGSEYIVHFVPPAIGTPAAEALQGNAYLFIAFLLVIFAPSKLGGKNFPLG